MEIRVLLVEDHDKTRLALSALLRQAGYQVRSAASGTDALTLLSQQCFDVVLTDIWMDGIDGIAVLHQARASAEAPAVILLTGSSSVETSIAALRAGAFDYLEKPFDPAILVQRVASAAQRRAAEQRQHEALAMLTQLADLVRDELGGAGPARRAPTPQGAALLQIGQLQIGANRWAVQYNHQLIDLTPTEYALLYQLAIAVGNAVPAGSLVRATHSHNLSESEAQKLIKAHVRNLRRKLPAGYLRTIRGRGYCLATPEDLPLGMTDSLRQVGDH